MEGGYDWECVPLLFIHNYRLEQKGLDREKWKINSRCVINFLGDATEMMAFLIWKL